VTSNCDTSEFPAAACKMPEQHSIQRKFPHRFQRPVFDPQLYCVGKGLDYPAGDIEGYIDDNKALMRRMYGNLVAEEQPEPEPQVDHRTPASTRPLPEVQFQSRGVRNFAGRFKRDVLEGKL